MDGFMLSPSFEEKLRRKYGTIQMGSTENIVLVMRVTGSTPVQYSTPVDPLSHTHGGRTDDAFRRGPDGRTDGGTGGRGRVRDGHGDRERGRIPHGRLLGKRLLFAFAPGCGVCSDARAVPPSTSPTEWTRGGDAAP